METHLQRSELFVAAATVAAHANAGAGTFRQRDVRFLVELFSNWIETSLQGESILVQNTQIQRYVDALVRDGYAKREYDRKLPIYRLTRLGILETLQRLHAQEIRVPEHLLFLYYFLSSYREKLIELIAKEGRQFPPALRLEIEALLDAKSILEAEKRRVKKELMKLRERIQDAKKAAQIAAARFRKGDTIAAVVAELEEKYPYELNSRKPLSELLGSVPSDIGRWELEVGNVKRPEIIWEPSAMMLEQYLRCLERL